MRNYLTEWRQLTTHHTVFLLNLARLVVGISSHIDDPFIYVCLFPLVFCIPVPVDGRIFSIIFPLHVIFLANSCVYRIVVRLVCKSEGYRFAQSNPYQRLHAILLGSHLYKFPSWSGKLPHVLTFVSPLVSHFTNVSFCPQRIGRKRTQRY